MTASNARPAVALLGGNGFGLYDRPYNQPDPDATEHWTSVRKRTQINKKKLIFFRFHDYRKYE